MLTARVQGVFHSNKLLGSAEILLSDVTLVDDPRVIKLDGGRGELNISIYFVEDSAEGKLLMAVVLGLGG